MWPVEDQGHYRRLGLKLQTSKEVTQARAESDKNPAYLTQPWLRPPEASGPSPIPFVRNLTTVWHHLDVARGTERLASTVGVASFS